MKHLKMLGLAVIAALGLMAFVGASSASATTLFTDAAHTIDYPAGTTLHFTLVPGTSLIWTDTSHNPIGTCTGATVHGFTVATTSTWIGSEKNTTKFESCSQTTDVLAAGGVEIMWTSGENGEVKGSGSQVTLNIFGVSCTYGTGTGTTLGTLSSGSAPELAVNANMPKISGGFLCPTWVIWEGLFYLTSPHALYITN